MPPSLMRRWRRCGVDIADMLPADYLMLLITPALRRRRHAIISLIF